LSELSIEFLHNLYQFRIQDSFFEQIIKLAMTPGIHPIKVNKNTIKKEPQPLSTTDNGGKTMHKIARNKDIVKRIKLTDSVKL
jgi:hypothetical protein